MTPEDLRTLAAIIIPAIGVGSSIYWRLYRRPIRKVRVQLGAEAAPREFVGRDWQDLLVVDFINERGETVQVQRVGFVYPGGARTFRSQARREDSPLPYDVLAGQRARYFFDREDLTTPGGIDLYSIPLFAWVEDSAGHSHTEELDPRVRREILWLGKRDLARRKAP